MSTVVKRSPENVRRALMEVVACEGKFEEAARNLKEAGILDVHHATLRVWADEFSEVYVELDKQAEKVREEELKDMLLARAHRAAEIEADLMEKVAGTTNPRDLPQALRAIADTKTKSIDSLMKLTGRNHEANQSLSAEGLLRSLAQSGLVKVNVELSEPKPSAEVDP